jgi:hypothetical protein
MNPLFEDYQTRGTIGPNPVLMNKQQLDVLRMIVQGYQGQQAQQGWLNSLENFVTPRPRPQEPVTQFQQLGIRG